MLSRGYRFASIPFRFAFSCLLLAGATFAGAQVAYGQSGWEEISLSGSRPSARAGHTFDSVGEEYFLFGGSGGGSDLNDLWKFDPEVDQFVQITPTTASPPARRHHTAVSLDGKLIVFGGLSGSTFRNDLWEYDPETNAWRELPTTGSRPPARAFHGSFTANGKIAVIGGLAGNGSTVLGDFWAYDPAASAWSQTTVTAFGIHPGQKLANRPPGGSGIIFPPEAFYGAYIIQTPSGKVFLVYGATLSGNLDTIYCFDPDNPSAGWVEINLQTTSDPIGLLAGVFTSNTMGIAIGGEDGDAQPVSDVTSFNVDGVTATLPPLPIPLSEADALVEFPLLFRNNPRARGIVQGRILVFGGRSTNGPSNRLFSMAVDIELPDPPEGPDLTGTWDSLTMKCKGSGSKIKCKLTGGFTLRNVGTLAANGSTLSFYLSNDAVLDESDTRIRQDAIAATNSGASQTISFRKFKLAKGTDGTGKFLLAVLDDGDVVEELSESNNVISFGPLQ